jgi:Ca2+/Na+ antiporter
MGANDEGNGADQPAHVWVGLFIIASLSFYAQALVTEERFVPAVNVIATHWNIPSDIAGATIMAAAASSPELFASLLSLFVTHSSLGLGTIVGSEIFNQLVIVAGSIQYSRNNRLKLDRAILVREVLFYGLSLVLFLLTLRDRRPTDDDELNNNHIYIGLGDGLLLLGGYALYVVVCAYFKQILGVVDRIKASIISLKGGKGDADDGGSGYNAYREGGPSTPQRRQPSRQATIDVPEMPFLRQLSHEPRANFHSVLSQDDSFSLNDGDVVPDIDPSVHDASSNASNRHPYPNDIAEANISTCSMLSSSSKKPSQMHALEEIEINEENGDASCFLWQQSQFYTKARVDLNAWHLRWFTFNDAFIESVPNRRDFNLHRIRYGALSDLQIDSDHLVMKFNCSSPEGRDFVLMAPCRKVFEVAVKACEHMMTNQEDLAVSASFESTSIIDHFGCEAEEVRSLVQFPDSGASALLVGIHVILLPVKALVHCKCSLLWLGYWKP